LFCIIPLEMRLAMLLFIIWDLFPVLRGLVGDPVSTGIGHAAHLGGALFGFLYARYHWRLERLVEHIPQMRWKRTPRLRIAPETQRETRTDSDMSSVDRVLEKISRSGQDSLNEEERAILRNASERLKRSRRDG
jgi:hypothetical protein